MVPLLTEFPGYNNKAKLDYLLFDAGPKITHQVTRFCVMVLGCRSCIITRVGLNYILIRFEILMFIGLHVYF